MGIGIVMNKICPNCHSDNTIRVMGIWFCRECHYSWEDNNCYKNVTDKVLDFCIATWYAEKWKEAI